MTLTFFTFLFAILWITWNERLITANKKNANLQKEFDKLWDAYNELNLKYRRDRIER